MDDQQRDERFAIEGDPEDALKALLKAAPVNKDPTPPHGDPIVSREKEPMRVDTCPDCLGDGFTKDPSADPLEECKTCDGKGWVPAK